MIAPKNIKVLEADYLGRPTYFIGVVDDNGKVVKALKYVMDGQPVWINRIAWAWHQPDKELVEKTFKENFDPEFQAEQERKRKQEEHDRAVRSLKQMGFYK